MGRPSMKPKNGCVVNLILHQVTDAAYPSQNIIPLILHANVYKKLALLRAFQDIQHRLEDECHRTF